MVTIILCDFKYNTCVKKAKLK